MQTELPESFEETVAFLKSYGALEEGHFILASGRHSGHYVKKGLLVQHPWEVARMLEQRRDTLEALGGIDVVLSPAVGGIAVGQQVGLLLHCRAVYAERGVDNAMHLKRGFEVRPGERVLLVEDVVTTGGTLGELRRFVERQGAVLAAVFALVNRSGSDSWDGVPLISCLQAVFPTFDPSDLPLELAALPAVRPGTKKVSG